jgi:hypothetical protein
VDGLLVGLLPWPDRLARGGLGCIRGCPWGEVRRGSNQGSTEDSGIPPPGLPWFPGEEKAPGRQQDSQPPGSAVAPSGLAMAKAS